MILKSYVRGKEDTYTFESKSTFMLRKKCKQVDPLKFVKTILLTKLTLLTYTRLDKTPSSNHDHNTFSFDEDVKILKINR